MATDLFLEMAELPATGSLGTGQLDTRDLLVAGVLISISSKYLYLYLALKVLTTRRVYHLATRSPFHQRFLIPAVQTVFFVIFCNIGMWNGHCCS